MMIKMMIAGLAAIAGLALSTPADARQGHSSWSVSVSSGAPYYDHYASRNYGGYYGGYRDPYVQYVPVYRYNYAPRYREYYRYDRPRYRHYNRGYRHYGYNHRRYHHRPRYNYGYGYHGGYRHYRPRYRHY
jgi:hypothetical protein